METFKAIGFCVSIKHADFMQNSFNKVGIKSISLHSGSDEKSRNEAKQKLQNGEINCIFTVDLFNEGVDIPDIDTVLFLRPTESITVFIQQLGRGLRISENKDALTVLDFVGQAHANYDFSFKLRALIGKTRRSIKEEINDDFPNMPAGCHIQLERIAKEYILNNIQTTTLRANDLRRMMSNFSLNFDFELTLDNYLSSYGIKKDQFYSNNSFYKLMFETSLKDGYEVKDQKELKESLRRFSRINSKRLLAFAEKLFENDLDLSKLTKQEKLMLGMIHYTIWGSKSYNYDGSIHRLKQDNTDIVKEALDIINYNKRNLKSIEIPYEDNSIPLDIYVSYTIQQVMVAFGKTTENHEYPMRQGVLYAEDKNTDLFFVTINKNEEDYLPSTMYNDYAINNELFNWESQSTTSINSPTGQRYIHDRSDSHKVLFFVRESKQEFGKSSPYVFLGNARYVSHKGSKPIQIVWKMDHPIPERIIRESSLRAIE